MENCIFCKIVDGDFDSVDLYENEVAKVFLDRFPSSNGHALVVSKQHFKDIYSVDEDVYAGMMRVAIRVAKAMKKVLNCDGINIVQNNEKPAGQSVFHIHIHVIPRYEGDAVSVGWTPTEPELEELEAVAEKMRPEIEKA